MVKGVKCKSCAFILPAGDETVKEGEFECAFCRLIDADVVKERIKANTSHGLPFVGIKKLDEIAIVGGGPSLKYTYPKIKEFQERGVKVMATNNTVKFLAQRGIIADYYIMMDGRQENAEFVRGGPKETMYLIGSSVHPDVVQYLVEDGREVVLWNPTIDKLRPELEKVFEQIAQEQDAPNARMSIGGGSTVCLRGIYMALIMGFNHFHLFGIDSSYMGHEHHAYPQAHNDQQEMLEITVAGKRYITCSWMIRQVVELVGQFWQVLTEYQISQIDAYGSGFMQDVIQLRKMGPVNFEEVPAEDLKVKELGA